MNGILIKGGRVIDPSRNGDGQADVLIQDGKIEAVGRNVPARPAHRSSMRPVKWWRRG